MQKRWWILGSFVVVLLWMTGVPQAQPRPGGTLRVAHPGDMTFFNANQGPAPGYNTFWVWNNLFNSLLSITPPPELKIVPELARAWDVLDNGQTYVFHLVEGVKFHDGTDFDAAAAKWNIDRIVNPEVKSWVRPYYEDIAAAEVVDKYTLRVRMKKPFGGFPIALAGYFQGIPMTSPTAFEANGKDWVRRPVGTGPFQLKEFVPGSHVTLEKNPHYFKPGLPYLDAIQFRIMKDPQTATTSLRTGEVDFVTRVPVKLVPIMEKAPNVEVRTGPEMGPTVTFLNLRVKPFDDLRARQAVGGFGLDRAEIARVAFQGRTKPLVSVLPPGVQGAMDLNEMYPYNPDKARQLLKELGYDDKNPLQFTILVGNHDATLADIAALVKNQLAKIGVEAKINLVDATTAVDRVLVKHEFDMYVSGFGSLIDINMRSVSFFKGMQSDYMGIDDPQVEATVHKWRESLDPAERDRISADLQRMIAEKLYWINVTGYPHFQAYRDYVKGFAFYDQTYLFLEKVYLNK